MNDQGKGNTRPDTDGVDANAGVQYQGPHSSSPAPENQSGSTARPETTTSNYADGTQPVAGHVAQDMTTRSRDTDPQGDVSASQPGVLPNRRQTLEEPHVQPPANPQAERARYESATDPDNRKIAEGMPLGGSRGIETVQHAADPSAEAHVGSPRAVELAEEQRLAVEPDTKGSFGVAGEPPSTPSTVSGSSDPMHS